MSHSFEFTDDDSDNFHLEENSITVDGYCEDCGARLTKSFSFMGSRIDEYECPYGEHEFVVQEYEKKSDTKVVVHSECEDCDATVLSYYEK